MILLNSYSKIFRSLKNNSMGAVYSYFSSGHPTTCKTLYQVNLKWLLTAYPKASWSEYGNLIICVNRPEILVASKYDHVPVAQRFFSLANIVVFLMQILNVINRY